MPRTILIADDDRTLTTMLRKVLEERGHDVLVANDGKDALQKFETGRPDLVILDIEMPEVNGYSFLFEMKKLDPGRPVPILVLTCKEELKEIFLVEGVKEYLVKPVSNEEILQKVEKYLS
jgi:DNA-binding response OmpR family regulator